MITSRFTAVILAVAAAFGASTASAVPNFNCPTGDQTKWASDVEEICTFAWLCLTPHSDIRRLDLFKRIVSYQDRDDTAKIGEEQYIAARLSGILQWQRHSQTLVAAHRAGFDSMLHRGFQTDGEREKWYNDLFKAIAQIEKNFPNKWETSKQTRSALNEILQEQSTYTIAGTGLTTSDYFGNSTKMFFTAIDIDIGALGIQDAIDGLKKSFQKLLNSSLKGLGNLGQWLVGALFGLAAFAMVWRIFFSGTLDANAVFLSFAQLIIMVAITLWLLAPVEVDGRDPDVSGSQAELAYSEEVGVSTRFMVWTSAGAEMFAKQVTSAFCESSEADTRSQQARDLHHRLCEERKEISPGAILGHGIYRAVLLLSIPLTHIATIEAESIWSVSDGAQYLSTQLMGFAMLAMAVVIGLAVVVLYLLIAMLLLFLWLEGYMVCAFGVFVLGFLANEWTRDKAVAYIWYAVGWIVRMSVMMVVYVVVSSAMLGGLASVGLTMTGQFAVPNIATFFILCVFEIITPLISIWLVNSVTNKIGEFFGSTPSQIGGAISEFASKQASSALSTAGNYAAAGTVMAAALPAAGVAAAGGAAGGAAIGSMVGAGTSAGAGGGAMAGAKEGGKAAFSNTLTKAKVASAKLKMGLRKKRNSE